jgi:hypothetical protein
MRVIAEGVIYMPQRSWTRLRSAIADTEPHQISLDAGHHQQFRMVGPVASLASIAGVVLKTSNLSQIVRGSPSIAYTAHHHARIVMHVTEINAR